MFRFYVLYRGCKCFFLGGWGGQHDNNDIERLGHDIPFCRPRQMEQAEKSVNFVVRRVTF